MHPHNVSPLAHYIIFTRWMGKEKLYFIAISAWFLLASFPFIILMDLL